MRRLLLTVVCLALVLPGGWAATAVADPSAGPTTVVRQAVADTAAACRRNLPVSDEQCAAVPMAPAVSERAIVAYEKGAVHRALQLQYELGNDLPLRTAPWLGTHNSFNTTARAASLSGSDSNQQLSMTDQLRIDVRSLEVDAHWFPSAKAGGAYAPVTCHARGADQKHAGCTDEPLLETELAPVATWLKAHRDQVVLLYLEDHLESSAGYAAAAAAVRKALGPLLYAPGGDRCTALPMDLTRWQVLAAGKQVVVMSTCAAGAGWNGLIYDDAARAKDETGPAGYGDKGSCDPARAPSAFDSRLLRVFEDSTALSATVEQGSEPITPGRAGALARCAVDITGFDQLLPDDGRLAASVWSWAPGQPSAGGCVVQRADSRWHAVACKGQRAFACRTPDGAWHLGRPRPIAAVASCPRGSTFDVPRYGYEGQRLAAAMSAAGVREAWLCYGRNELGRFSACREEDL